MSDIVFINGLALRAYHGSMPHESKVGQTFLLDLVLDIDLIAASRSDKFEDTVSYDSVVKIVTEVFCSQRYRLLEVVARAVADKLLKRCTRVNAIRVTVRKPHAPVDATFGHLGVKIERARMQERGAPKSSRDKASRVAEVP